MMFLVEVYTPEDCVGSTTARARGAADGGALTLRRAIYVAADETLFLLVDAASAADTREALTRAAVPFHRIHDAREDA